MIQNHDEVTYPDLPEHVNDEDGHISLLLMGIVMVLLLLLVVSILMAM
jgi:hypothetical protein